MSKYLQTKDIPTTLICILCLVLRGLKGIVNMSMLTWSRGDMALLVFTPKYNLTEAQ